jgi:hypothetical protein
LIKTGEACQRYRKSPAAFSRYVSRGALLSDGSRLKLKATHTPRGYLFDEADIDAFFATLEADRLAPYRNLD